MMHICMGTNEMNNGKNHAPSFMCLLYALYILAISEISYINLLGINFCAKKASRMQSAKN